jgi:hypothetical protein
MEARSNDKRQFSLKGPIFGDFIFGESEAF